MKVQITAYKCLLVIATDKPQEGVGEDWFPVGEGRLGCVLGDTKNQLGISKEAWELMEKIPQGRDAIGDLMWWKTDDGKHAFGWFGGVNHIIDPEHAETDRTFKMFPGEYTEIPNETPGGAMEAIDEECECGHCGDEH